MKKLIILALATLCIASCGNATVVNNERIGWVMEHSK